MDFGCLKKLVGLFNKGPRAVNPVGLRIAPDLHIVFPHKRRRHPAQVARKLDELDQWRKSGPSRKLVDHPDTDSVYCAHDEICDRRKFLNSWRLRVSCEDDSRQHRKRQSNTFVHENTRDISRKLSRNDGILSHATVQLPWSIRHHTGPSRTLWLSF